MEESEVQFQVYVKDKGSSDDHWEDASDTVSSEHIATKIIEEMVEDDAEEDLAYDYKIVKWSTVKKDHKLFLHGTK